MKKILSTLAMMVTKALLLSIFAFTLTTPLHAATLYWVGGDGDSYNNASDWHTTDPAVCLDDLGDGSVPGAADAIVFDADCDNGITIDADWTLNSITINAGYTGTITQNDATNWTIDSTGGFTANGGTYSPQGTTSAFRIMHTSGTSTIDTSAMGGSFNDVLIDTTNDTVSITTSMDIDGDLTLTDVAILNGGTINVSGNVTVTETAMAGSATILFDGGNNQTLQVDAAGGTAEIVSISINKSGGTLTLADNIKVSPATTVTCWTYTAGTVDAGTSKIIIDEDGGANTLTVNSGAMIFNDVEITGGGDTVVVTGTMDIDGDFFMTTMGNVNTGTITVSGDVTVTDTDLNGSATLLFDGANDQTFQVDGAGGVAEIFKISINKTGGTLTMKDEIRVSPAVTGTVWTYTAGNVDAGTSTIVFHEDGNSNVQTINSGAMSFNNVTFTGGSSDDAVITGNLDVNGDLSITEWDQINTGNINVAGDISSSDGGVSGSATITLDGTGAQNITPASGTAEFTGAGIIINKASGTVTLMSNNLALSDAGEDLTITEGVLDLNGLSLTVADDFTVEDGGTLQLQGDETVTISGTTDFQSGSTALYDGTGSYTTSLAAGNAYHHLTFNGSGGVWEPNGAVTVGGDLTITNGTLDIDSQNLTVTGTFSNADTLRLQGGETTVSLTMDTDSGTVEYDGGGSYTGLKAGNAYNNLTISGAGTFDLNNDLDIDGNFILSAGTLDVTAAGCDAATNPCDITLEGNWTNSGGTFTERTGTVTLDGTNHTFQGSEGFYNLSKTESTNDSTNETLTFDDGQTITVTGTWTLDGRDADDQLLLVSDNPGTQWNVNPTTRAIDFVTVTDSNNTNATAITCSDNCTDGGAGSTNTNWTFDTTNPSISTLSPSDGQTSVTLDGNLVITFDEVVDVETGNITIFKTSDNSTVEVIDVTSGQVTGTGTTTITINPTSDLEDGTDYYIQIDATGFDDPSMNSFSGITDSTTWNFATTVTLDNKVFDIALEVLSGNTAKTGDILEGKLLITNNKNTSISDTNIHLTLPNGMTYLKDSVQSTDSITIDSITQNPNEIVININSIASGLTLEPLSFKLMIGTNTTPGESLNLGAYTDNV